MFEIQSGSSVPAIPTKSTFFSSCSKMIQGDYASVDFKSLDDCKRHQKISHIALVRNGYKAVTRKTKISDSKFTLQIWCVRKEKKGENEYDIASGLWG